MTEKIDELISYMEIYDPRNTFSLEQDEVDLIIDALIFYKEMQVI